MPLKSLKASIYDALSTFLAEYDIESPPQYLVDAVEEDIGPAIARCHNGGSELECITGAIWDSSVFALRDITSEEKSRYSNIMYAMLLAHGHL